ncbi:metallophosphoesterase 1 isoform X2 [Megalobrama amblycephala]|uniref:metallophosphoesterase 1 isoform X2 n=1 Tax=Megalobrama amblycephala TaxID=75352 RepID=UPI0020140B94|nr:metallophosphoesterase 1 isoform X2 [Megalobrama amblycephala]
MISMFGSSGRLAVSLIFAFVSVFILCEYVIYYPVIMRCSWPHIETEDSHSPLRALFLSDTHLLGAIRGHWLDKLRREWQMERAFQTSLWLLNPEVVFILGDVFDEGKWSSSQDWEDDVRRFKRIFRHSSDTKLVVLIGNHDIGFHNEMTKQKLERFEQVFNVTSARILTIRGVNFLLVNSVALHGDHCPICQRVEEELHKLSYALNCSFQQANVFRAASPSTHGDRLKTWLGSLTSTFLPNDAVDPQHLSNEQLDDNLKRLMAHDLMPSYKEWAKVIPAIAHNLKLQAEDARRNQAQTQRHHDQRLVEIQDQRWTADESKPELQEELQRLQKALAELHLEVERRELTEKLTAKLP